jgi:hypothetical protein
MDYFSLYSSYHFDELLSLMFTVFGVTILVLLIAYNIDDAVKASRKESTFTLLSYGNVGVLVVALSFMAFGYGIKLSQNGSITELNNTTVSICGDTLDSVIHNVKYLSKRYDNKVESFKFMYGDNIISKEQYVNDILNEFYNTGSSDSLDYNAEFKDATVNLRKGM